MPCPVCKVGLVFLVLDNPEERAFVLVSTCSRTCLGIVRDLILTMTCGKLFVLLVYFALFTVLSWSVPLKETDVDDKRENDDRTNNSTSLKKSDFHSKGMHDSDVNSYTSSNQGESSIEHHSSSDKSHHGDKRNHDRHNKHDKHDKYGKHDKHYKNGKHDIQDKHDKHSVKGMSTARDDYKGTAVSRKKHDDDDKSGTSEKVDVSHEKNNDVAEEGYDQDNNSKQFTKDGQFKHEEHVKDHHDGHHNNHSVNPHINHQELNNNKHHDNHYDNHSAEHYAHHRSGRAENLQKEDSSSEYPKAHKSCGHKTHEEKLLKRSTSSPEGILAAEVKNIDEVKRENSKDDEYAKRTARVVNGEPVTDNGEFPYVVDISNSDQAISSTRFCTGTLIKNDTILTAAHCVLNEGYTSSVYATVGRVELDDKHEDNEPSMTFRTIASMVHPEYDGIGSPKDVAVLLLNESCDAPTVNLAERTPEENEEAWVVGYGIQRIGTLEEVAQPVEILSGRLQKTKLQIVPRADCDAPQTSLQTPEGLLCTRGVKLGSSACMGDSGGGLFLRKGNEAQQVGIVSYGDSECASEESGVFTDIAHVREWIEYASDKMQKALHPTLEFEMDDKAEIVHLDRIGEKMLVHRGHPASSHHAKYYTMRTNFSQARHVKVSLCDGPSGYAARLSAKNEKDKSVVYDDGSCPDGKLSQVTLPGLMHDMITIGVSGNGSTPIRLSFSSSNAS